MKYAELPRLINAMYSHISGDVSICQVDGMADISNIIKAMNEETLPKEAYWLTCENGTQFGFADERIANSSVCKYVMQNENSILNARENEHCYKINFDDVSVEEIKPRRFVKAVKNLSKSIELCSDVYLKDFNYAKENDEIEIYHRSKAENQKCIEAIIQNIADNTNYQKYGQTVNVAKALTLTLNSYSINRIAYVSATTVYNSLCDNRYDTAVKEWAKEMFYDLPLSVCKNSVENTIYSGHPVILNSFFQKVIAEQQLQENEKPTIDKVEAFYLSIDKNPDQYFYNEIKNNFTERDVYEILTYISDINSYRAANCTEMSQEQRQFASQATEAACRFVSLLEKRENFAEDVKKVIHTKGEIAHIGDNQSIETVEQFSNLKDFENAVDAVLKEYGAENEGIKFCINDHTPSGIYAQRLHSLRENAKKRSKTSIERS